MTKIQLTQQKIATISRKDFDKIAKYKWQFNGRYAVRKNNSGKTIYMHREIMQTPENLVTDHIDGDGLNNKRSNLRICTYRQNFRNQKISKNNTTGIKGVVWNKQNKNWLARLTIDNKRIHLGSFKTKELAMQIRNKYAKKYYGKYAKEIKKESVSKKENKDEVPSADSNEVNPFKGD